MWASQVFVRLRKALVFGAVANREYEGELRFGDRINIDEVGAVTVNDYTRYTDISWQEPDAAEKILYVDQASYGAVEIDDIDRVQAKADVVAALSGEMAYALADTVDQHLAGLYTQAGGSVSAITGTAGNVLKNVADFQQELDENNVSGAERFIIIPHWYHSYLLQAATGIIGHTGVPKVFDNGMLSRGFVGSLFGMNVLVSKNVNNNSTVWNVVALTRQALYHVMQISEMEMLRREDRFANGLRSLLVYGSKVIRPQAMISCAVTKG
jgi:hypothetical protein